MMKTIWISVILQVLELVSGVHSTTPFFDPCTDYVEINDVNSQRLFTTSRSGEGNCDSAMDEGWYRFRLNRREAQLPTVCIKNDQCGTRLPLRFDLGGNELPGVNVTLWGHVCTSYGILGEWDCCVLRRPAAVRNCGDYFTYFLSQPDRCPVAYCLQEVGQPPSDDFTVNTGEPIAESRTANHAAIGALMERTRRSTELTEAVVTHSRTNKEHSRLLPVSPLLHATKVKAIPSASATKSTSARFSYIKKTENKMTLSPPRIQESTETNGHPIESPHALKGPMRRTRSSVSRDHTSKQHQIYRRNAFMKDRQRQERRNVGHNRMNVENNAGRRHGGGVGPNRDIVIEQGNDGMEHGQIEHGQIIDHSVEDPRGNRPQQRDVSLSMTSPIDPIETPTSSTSSNFPSATDVDTSQNSMPPPVLPTETALHSSLEMFTSSQTETVHLSRQSTLTSSILRTEAFESSQENLPISETDLFYGRRRKSIQTDILDSSRDDSQFVSSYGESTVPSYLHLSVTAGMSLMTVKLSSTPTVMSTSEIQQQTAIPTPIDLPSSATDVPTFSPTASSSSLVISQSTQSAQLTGGSQSVTVSGSAAVTPSISVMPTALPRSTEDTHSVISAPTSPAFQSTAESPSIEMSLSITVSQPSTESLLTALTPSVALSDQPEVFPSGVSEPSVASTTYAMLQSAALLHSPDVFPSVAMSLTAEHTPSSPLSTNDEESSVDVSESTVASPLTSMAPVAPVYQTITAASSMVVSSTPTVSKSALESLSISKYQSIAASRSTVIHSSVFSQSLPSSSSTPSTLRYTSESQSAEVSPSFVVVQSSSWSKSSVLAQPAVSQSSLVSPPSLESSITVVSPATSASSLVAVSASFAISPATLVHMSTTGSLALPEHTVDTSTNTVFPPGSVFQPTVVSPLMIPPSSVSSSGFLIASSRPNKSSPVETSLTAITSATEPLSAVTSPVVFPSSVISSVFQAPDVSSTSGEARGTLSYMTLASVVSSTPTAEVASHMRSPSTVETQNVFAVASSFTDLSATEPLSTVVSPLTRPPAVSSSLVSISNLVVSTDVPTLVTSPEVSSVAVPLYTAAIPAHSISTAVPHAVIQSDFDSSSASASQVATSSTLLSSREMPVSATVPVQGSPAVLEPSGLSSSLVWFTMISSTTSLAAVESSSVSSSNSDPSPVPFNSYESSPVTVYPTIVSPTDHISQSVPSSDLVSSVTVSPQNTNSATAFSPTIASPKVSPSIVISAMMSVDIASMVILPTATSSVVSSSTPVSSTGPLVTVGRSLVNASISEPSSAVDQSSHMTPLSKASFTSVPLPDGVSPLVTSSTPVSSRVISPSLVVFPMASSTMIESVVVSLLTTEATIDSLSGAPSASSVAPSVVPPLLTVTSTHVVVSSVISSIETSSTIDSQQIATTSTRAATPPMASSLSSVMPSSVSASIESTSSSLGDVHTLSTSSSGFHSITYEEQTQKFTATVIAVDKTTGSPQKLDCSGAEHACHSGRVCLGPNSRGQTRIRCLGGTSCGILCDTFPDCPDGSDESANICGVTMCTENRQLCPDGIGCYSRCDGNVECNDRSDERGCDGVNRSHDVTGHEESALDTISAAVHTTTEAAVATEAALATEVGLATEAALATEADPTTEEVLATEATLTTGAALATEATPTTEAALATETALATEAAIATENALATDTLQPSTQTVVIPRSTALAHVTESEQTTPPMTSPGSTQRGVPMTSPVSRSTAEQVTSVTQNQTGESVVTKGAAETVEPMTSTGTAESIGPVTTTGSLHFTVRVTTPPLTQTTDTGTVSDLAQTEEPVTPTADAETVGPVTSRDSTAEVMTSSVSVQTEGSETPSTSTLTRGPVTSAASAVITESPGVVAETTDITESHAISSVTPPATALPTTAHGDMSPAVTTEVAHSTVPLTTSSRTSASYRPTPTAEEVPQTTPTTTHVTEMSHRTSAITSTTETVTISTIESGASSSETTTTESIQIVSQAANTTQSALTIPAITSVTESAHTTPAPTSVTESLETVPTNTRTTDSPPVTIATTTEAPQSSTSTTESPQTSATTRTSGLPQTTPTPTRTTTPPQTTTTGITYHSQTTQMTTRISEASQTTSTTESPHTTPTTARTTELRHTTAATTRTTGSPQITPATTRTTETPETMPTTTRTTETPETTPATSRTTETPETMPTTTRTTETPETTTTTTRTTDTPETTPTSTSTTPLPPITTEATRATMPPTITSRTTRVTVPPTGTPRTATTGATTPSASSKSSSAALPSNDTASTTTGIKMTTDVAVDKNETVTKPGSSPGSVTTIAGIQLGLFIFLVVSGTCLFAILVFAIVGLAYRRHFHTWSPEMAYQDAYGNMEKANLSFTRDNAAIESPISDAEMMKDEDCPEKDTTMTLSDASTLACPPTPGEHGYDVTFNEPEPEPHDRAAIYSPVTAENGLNHEHLNPAFDGRDGVDGVAPISELTEDVDAVHPRNNFPWIEDTKL